jgi:replicative DNA helicase
MSILPKFRSRDREIWKAIHLLERQQMANQQEVDAITTEVQKVSTDLGTVKTMLQEEIDKLAEANPSIDLSGLKTAVEPLDAAVEALGSLQPLTPAPTPEA